MRRLHTLFAVAGAAVALAGQATAADRNGPDRAKTSLRGFEEVPVVLTNASGELKLRIDDQASMIEYELSYEGLQGTVTQAHIHIGQRDVNGGITVWLCQTTTNPSPTPVPTCPQTGTVTGTITPSSVIGPAAQGVSAGELADVIRLIRAGKAYGNVHTSQSPGGEIRGQLP